MNLLKQIIHDDWMYFNYILTKRMNGFFYYLRKIPLLNKSVSDNIFAAYHLKEALSIFFTIVIVLFSFAKKFATLIFFICLSLIPIVISANFDFELLIKNIFSVKLQHGILLWFLLTVILSGFYTQFSPVLKQKKIQFMTKFNLPSARFIIGQKVIVLCKQTIFYIPAAFFYSLFGRNWIYFTFIPLAFLTCNLGFILLNRWLFMKSFGTGQRRLLSIAYSGLLGIIVSLVFYLDWFSQLEAILISWPTILLFLGLALYFFKIVLTCTQDFSYGQKSLQFNTIFYQKIKQSNEKSQQYMALGLKMQKKLTFTPDTFTEHLTGSNYLNALLFHRYKQVFKRKFIYISLAFGSCDLTILSAKLFNIPFFTEEKTAAKLLPSLFFIMYFASFGKQIVQMVFLNCDSAMLYYPFYREGKTILKGFTYRFRKTFLYNSLIISNIFGVFLLLHITHNFLFSWQFFCVLFLLLVSLAFLFSFHELFIYYLLQPFTNDLSVKNPFYKIITWGFYYFSYLNVNLDVSGFSYTIIVSIVCLLYVSIGLIIIYRIAPKTFKIKT